MLMFYVLILVLTAASAQALPRFEPIFTLSPITFTLLYLGIHLVLAAWSVAICQSTAKFIKAEPFKQRKALRRMSRLLSPLLPLALLAYLVAIFGFSWHLIVSEQIGDLILINKLLIMLPALSLPVCIQLAIYNVEKALHEKIDPITGERIPWHVSRLQSLLMFIRHQLMMILFTLLLLILMADLVDYFIKDSTWNTIATISGLFLIFVTSPVLLSKVFRTSALEAGPLRDRLLHMCKHHNIRVRNILLWHTHQSMVNGAVIGLFGWLRYILLTDALLKSMQEDHIEAVMAHELGHVKRHHMFWMLIATGGLLSTVTGFTYLALYALKLSFDFDPLWLFTFSLQNEMESFSEAFGHMMLFLFVVVVWALGFGWISRRYERQADTFSVQTLSKLMYLDQKAKTSTQGVNASEHAEAPITPSTLKSMLDSAFDQTPEPPFDEHRLHPAAVHAMSDALLEVARLNHILPERFTWRHGSIQARVDYLQSLIGQDGRDCSIDKLVVKINYGMLSLLLLSNGIIYLLESGL